MNVFLYELRVARNSAVAWALSLVVLTSLFLSGYPAFSENAQEVKKLLGGLPFLVQKAIGISIDTITTLNGYYGFVLMYILLCGAVQATSLGLAVISRETVEKTEDFLLTKPVSRTTILSGKLMAALVAIVGVNLVFLPASLLTASAAGGDSFDAARIALLSGTLLPVQLFFLAIGVSIAAMVPRIPSVHTASLATVFGFFLLNLFGSVLGDRLIRYLTPFQYYVPRSIVSSGSYELHFVLVEALVIGVAIAASFFRYTTRDVPA